MQEESLKVPVLAKTVSSTTNLTASSGNQSNLQVQQSEDQISSVHGNQSIHHLENVYNNFQQPSNQVHNSSEIIESFNSLNVYDFLNACSQFINKRNFNNSNQNSNLFMKASLKQSSNLLIQSSKQDQRQQLSKTCNYQSNIKQNSMNKSSMNNKSNSRQCPQCRYHLSKQLKWVQEKQLLELKIKQLYAKIKQINQKSELICSTITQEEQKQYGKQIRNDLNCINYEEIGVLQQNSRQKVSNSYKNNSNSQQYFKNPYNSKLQIQPQIITISIQPFLINTRKYQTTSILQNEAIQVQLSDPSNQQPASQPLQTETQTLLQSLKQFTNKLNQFQQENKYLKIQNRILSKTKDQIENIKKQVQKTKSQRDLFKKKLITIVSDKKNNNTNQQQNNFNNKNKNLLREQSNVNNGLKQRKGWAHLSENKKQSLFELSLTDDPSSSQSSNFNMIKGTTQNNMKNQRKYLKKRQRIHFTTIQKSKEEMIAQTQQKQQR